MKLWYQSMTAHGAHSVYTDEVRRVVSEATPAGCETRIVGIPRASEFSDHQYLFYEFADTRDVISNALRAEQEGYSAFLIGNIADPGIHHARELTSFPVIGLGEVTLFTARQMGRRLGLVAINERQMAQMELRIAELNISRDIVGIECLDIARYGDIHSSYQRAAGGELLDKFADRVASLSRLGAEVVVPVGGLVMALLSKAGISSIGQVPVVNGIYALAAVGAAYAALYESQGIFTSKRLSYAGPPPAALADIRRREAGQLSDTPVGVDHNRAAR